MPARKLLGLGDILAEWLGVVQEYEQQGRSTDRMLHLIGQLRPLVEADSTGWQTVEGDWRHDKVVPVGPEPEPKPRKTRQRRQPPLD